MAQAIVGPVFSAIGKGHPILQRVLTSVIFWGADVPEAIDSLEHSMEIFIAPNWTIPMLKAAVTSAVQNKAVALGLTVASTDVYMRDFTVGFSPADVAGLVQWLDAAAITGLVDGDPIGTWADQSGLGNHATQATAAQKPTYKTAVLNSRPIVRFDGVDDGFITTLNQAQPFTCFAVMQHATGSVTNNQSIMAGTSAGTDAQLTLGNATPDDIRVYAGLTVIWGALDANAHVISAVFNGASSNLSVDGSLAAGNVGTRAANPVTFGSGGATPYTGDLAEWLVYNVALTQANVDSIESYLGTKWGVTVA